jgi:hypothetical protein
MKIKTKVKKVVFVGHCSECGTEFELSKYEKIRNEILFCDYDRKGRRVKGSSDKKFYCPVCRRVSEFESLRKAFIMENGIEHTVW